VDLEGKWKVIIIGGAITGLASLVPVINLACCLIPFLGAIVAVAIYSSSIPPPVLNNNEGVVLGAMTGIIGSALYAVLIIPLVIILGNTIGRYLGQVIPDVADVPARLQPLVQGLLAHFGSILAVIVIFKILSQLALSLIFGILGGVVVIAIFRRTRTV